jgi:TonB-linked SusC/RagA family outer membrane protein
MIFFQPTADRHFSKMDKFSRDGSSQIKLLRIMKLTAIIFLAFCLQVSAAGFSQLVTLKANNRLLESVLQAIKKQTGFTYIATANILDHTNTVTVNFKNAPLEIVLEECFKGQPLKYSIDENIIVIEPLLTQDLSPGSNKKGRGLSLSAPPINIRGRVTDENGNSVSGASVIIKENNRGVSTNNNGEFELKNVNDDAILIISGINIQTQEIRINGKTEITILVKARVKEEEEVVVAYNKTTQRALTGAVTVVKGETIADLPNRSFERSLQGRVPGLLITNGNGQPGGGTSNFVLRGIGTGAFAMGFSSGVRQPLIVVDGIPLSTFSTLQSRSSTNAAPAANPLSLLNPSDIASITVLKDADAIALYGSQASNGVLLITTKKGNSGGTRFIFHHQLDVAKPINRSDRYLNAAEYLQLTKDTYKATDPVLWTDAAIDANLKSNFPTYTVDGKQEFYDRQNWFKAFYNDAATTVTNELSISGGNEKIQNYANLSYVNQKGTVRHTGFKRLSVRYNYFNQVKKWLNFGLNSNVSYTSTDYPADGANIESNLDAQGSASNISPLNPVRLQNGEFNLFPFVLPGAYVNNPVAELEYNINNTKSYVFTGGAFVEINFLHDFTAKSIVGVNILKADILEKVDPRLSVSYSSPGVGSIYNGSNSGNRITNTNTLNYHHIFSSNHFFNILAGEEVQLQSDKVLSAGKTGLLLPSLEDLSAAINLNYANGVQSKTNLISYFARASYSHNQIQFLNIGYRRDGSSKFGNKDRYADFWSVGAAWVLSNELFLSRYKNWLTYFKIRASIGTSGNSATVGATTRFDLISARSYNGNVAANYTPGNDQIRWETTLNKDLGLEFNFFNRISGTLDFYRRDISNLLYSYILPYTSGIPSNVQNIGKMKNNGIEASLSTDILKGRNFTWNLNINWSKNVNKLIKANAPVTPQGSLVNQEGQNFNSYYLVRWAGVDPADGTPQWLDKEGNITKTYSLNNTVITGKPQPDGFGGITNTFTYKSWELSAFLYYQYGYKILDLATSILINDGRFVYLNQIKGALDYWKKEGDISPNPRRLLNNADGGNQISTRYLYDGDYIRLKNIRLSYSFNSNFVRALKLSGIKASLQTNNLFLITKFNGFDPESIGNGGEANFPYPQSRSFSLDMNITF